MEKLGIENLKKIVVIAGEFANATPAIAGGAGFLGKIQAASGLFDDIMSLSSIDYSMALDEIMDLSAAEAAELHKVFAVKFDIDADLVESAIEDALWMVVDLYDVVKEARVYYKKYFAKAG